MTLNPYLSIIARGKGRGRSLTQAEAQEAMQIILQGKAAPEALGAFLMVLRYRGKTAPITYLPLETLSPLGFELLNPRRRPGLRSCINTVRRMWNPTGAPASVQGVFHPSYRGLQACAAEALGQHTLSIIKGGDGEFERHPGKEIEVFALWNGQHHATKAPARQSQIRRLLEVSDDIDAVTLWTGAQQDELAEATVTGTVGPAVWILDAASDVQGADFLARTLWEERHGNQRRTA
jgi:anthranilate phosphoribosyltransferase